MIICLNVEGCYDGQTNGLWLLLILSLQTKERVRLLEIRIGDLEIKFRMFMREWEAGKS